MYFRETHCTIMESLHCLPIIQQQPAADLPCCLWKIHMPGVHQGVNDSKYNVVTSYRTKENQNEDAFLQMRLIVKRQHPVAEQYVLTACIQRKYHSEY